MNSADVGIAAGLMAVGFVTLLNVGSREGNWKLWAFMVVLLAARGLLWLLTRDRRRRLLAADRDDESPAENETPRTAQ